MVENLKIKYQFNSRGVTVDPAPRYNWPEAREPTPNLNILRVKLFQFNFHVKNKTAPAYLSLVIM